MVGDVTGHGPAQPDHAGHIRRLRRHRLLGARRLRRGRDRRPGPDRRGHPRAGRHVPAHPAAVGAGHRPPRRLRPHLQQQHDLRDAVVRAPRHRPGAADRGHDPGHPCPARSTSRGSG
jgi:hypothetical protein